MQYKSPRTLPFTCFPWSLFMPMAFHIYTPFMVNSKGISGSIHLLKNHQLRTNWTSFASLIPFIDTTQVIMMRTFCNNSRIFKSIFCNKNNSSLEINYISNNRIITCSWPPEEGFVLKWPTYILNDIELKYQHKKHRFLIYK